uniref:Purinergic receptor P2X 6 n=1 Tax=Ovis aries TaxID=9940 RepID=A0AC11DQ46_SHEEP
RARQGSADCFLPPGSHSHPVGPALTRPLAVPGASPSSEDCPPQRCLSSFRWALLTKKGYQEQDLDPQISVITKLKGVSVTRIEELGNRLWDVADFVKPPQTGSLRLVPPGKPTGGCCSARKRMK